MYIEDDEIAMTCLEPEETDEELDYIEDKIEEELDSVYSDPGEIEPDDSDVSLVGMDVEEDLDADFSMAEDEDEAIIDMIENDDI